VLNYLEAIGRFEAAFIEAHKASRIIHTVRLLKSQLITGSYFEEIISSSNEVLKYFQSNMAEEIRKLGNLT